jgi:hypothetical protein
MKLYAKVENNVITRIAVLPSLLSHLSLIGVPITDEFLQSQSVVEVVDVLPFDENTQRLQYVEPYMLNNMAYTCIVVDMTVEEKEQYRLNKLEGQWQNIRDDRNNRLSECDWTQLPDVSVNQYNWAEYRQKLRDITKQPDPFNIDWPVKP